MPDTVLRVRLDPSSTDDSGLVAAPPPGEAPDGPGSCYPTLRPGDLSVEMDRARRLTILRCGRCGAHVQVRTVHVSEPSYTDPLLAFLEVHASGCESCAGSLRPA